MTIRIETSSQYNKWQQKCNLKANHIQQQKIIMFQPSAWFSFIHIFSPLYVLPQWTCLIISFLVIFYAESAYLPRKNKKFFFFIKRILISIITGKTILSTETAPFLYDSVDFLTKRQHLAAYTKVLLTFINKKGIFKWYVSFKYSSCLSTICYKIIN